MNATAKNWTEAVVLLGLGAAGGLMAQRIGLPMPFMIGSLLVIAIYAILVTDRYGREVFFPKRFRTVFIALIGVLIGAGFSPDVLAILPHLWVSLVAILAFVAVTHAFGYAIFRRFGGYDRTTALFASMPGGLVEAIMLGEKAGGDVRLLTVHHFARIVLVVVTVPAIIYLWSGEVVGSAAGQSFASEGYDVSDLAAIAATALAGIVFGRLLRLPASHLMGPLVLSAILNGSGLMTLTSPGWLISLAQLVVGVGLGAQFSGLNRHMLMKGFGLGLVSVVAMLAIGAVFTLGLVMALPIDHQALFISFAPGGVTEMSLIALSLDTSPVVVATHHLFRIIATVLMVGWLTRFWDFSPEDE